MEGARRVEEVLELMGERRLRCERKTVLYDFEDLYGVGIIQDSPAALLMRILETYNLQDKILVVLDIPFMAEGKLVVVDNINARREEVRSTEELEDLICSGDREVMRVLLFDGHDWAEAVLELPKEGDA